MFDPGGEDIAFSQNPGLRVTAAGTSHTILALQAQYVDSLYRSFFGITYIFVNIEFIYLILFIKARVR
jgi:hypothetical protein